MTDRELLEDILSDINLLGRFDFKSYDLEKTYCDHGSYCNSWDIDDIKEKIKKHLDKTS